MGALSGAAIGNAQDEIEAKNRAMIAQQLGRQVAAGAVRVNDVIAMTRAGVNEELIINHIRAHGMIAPLQTERPDQPAAAGHQPARDCHDAGLSPPQPQPVMVEQPAPPPVIVESYPTGRTGARASIRTSITAGTSRRRTAVNSPGVKTGARWRQVVTIFRRQSVSDRSPPTRRLSIVLQAAAGQPSLCAYLRRLHANTSRLMPAVINNTNVLGSGS